ncbi:hypothetical protein Vadar_004195 [Vaccinium darrowii]|uniref:Uncharacterized protein n=1 Tax=Vaccinium darrowii TaxID=229202 RepID=A0ACB7X801_9ERIC|nr:hypothetical protein Vadar_004195 [Vaccinium darrowii]
MVIVDQSAIQNAEDTEKITEVGCSIGPRSELTACLVSVFQIGLVCSSDSPQDRLDMRNATTELLSIRETFLRSGIHKEQNYSQIHNHRSIEFPKQSESDESKP